MAHRQTLPWKRGSGPFRYPDKRTWSWHCNTCSHFSDYLFPSRGGAAVDYTMHIQKAHEGCLP